MFRFFLLPDPFVWILYFLDFVMKNRCISYSTINKDLYDHMVSLNTPLVICCQVLSPPDLAVTIAEPFQRDFEPFIS